MDELEKALQYARDVGVSTRQVASVVKAHVDEVRFRQTEGVTLVQEIDGAEREITVPESSVEQYKSSGWVVKQDEPAEEPAEEPAAAAAEETSTPQPEEK